MRVKLTTPVHKLKALIRNSVKSSVVCSVSKKVQTVPSRKTNDSNIYALEDAKDVRWIELCPRNLRGWRLGRSSLGRHANLQTQAMERQ